MSIIPRLSYLLPYATTWYCLIIPILLLPSIAFFVQLDFSDCLFPVLLRAL